MVSVLCLAFAHVHLVSTVIDHKLNDVPSYVFFSGSSRQFVGFSTEMNESVIDRIWERAGEFFPTLRELSLRDFRQSRKVRIGLRPYSKYTIDLIFQMCDTFSILVILVRVCDL